MSKTAPVLALLTLLLLLALAAFIHLKLVPVFTALMNGWGVAFGPAARFAIGTASAGFPALALLLTLALGVWKAPGPHKVAVVQGGVLLLTVFLALQCAVFVDVAITVPAWALTQAEKR